MNEEGVRVGGSVDYTATGRFTFHKRNLYYSFYSSSTPRGIQFLDLRGNILEEQVLDPYSPYQNATGKVCGVWRRIPREYRRLIREEKLVVSLLWQRADLSISGQLYRYRTLSTEMYSALLEGGLPGSGGTAIVSVSTTAPSIHVTVIFNGLFTAADIADVPLTLKLHTHDKQTLVLDEVIRVEKPSGELNTIEARSAVSSNDLRLLSRHRLTVTVASRSSDLSMSGRVVARANCELYQALLSHHTDPLQDKQAAGLAWMYVDYEGALRYHIQVEKVTKPFDVTLVVERRIVELEDLTPNLRDGWINGTLDRLSPKHLEQLYNGELGVNVATAASRSVVRGRLTPRAASDPRNTPQGPSLLRPYNPHHYRTTGMAWAAVDIECHLHYEIQMTGPNMDSGDYELYLSEVPLVAPGAPVSRRFIERFSGSSHEGSALGLVPNELARIESGLVHLEVADIRTSNTLLLSDWTKPHYSDNDVPSIMGYNSDRSGGGGGGSAESPLSCYHGGRFHEEGAQWRSPVDRCVVCHCSAGRVACEPLVCPTPPPSCQPHRLPDQCCHTCHNSTEELDTGRGCTMAGQFFLPGSSWHPYLPPSGFDTCTVCTCNALSLKVTCPRVECPALACDEKTAIRPDKKACCKVCPSQLQAEIRHRQHHTQHPGAQGDQPSVITDADILAAGGCSYPVEGPYRNGQEWHPRIYSHGEVKCVKCWCKDGKVRCERKRCTKWSCSDECCQAKCGRKRRHTFKHLTSRKNA
ncbi:hypothetical protein AAG570_009797 [Ranatra chinensis]|uniref:Chordin n=1 Tax=Ranatra chinensis TaxID=642074 RepID=A0ABD0YQ41_9HEMI